MGAKRSLAVLAVVGAFALTACSSGPDESSASADNPTSGDQKLVSVKIGATGAISNVDLKLGVQKGIFKEEGLDVSVQWAQGGAAVVPAILNGELQFADSSTISLILANAKKLPVTVIASGSQGASDAAQDTVGVIVAADSPIRAPADLAGKTIAVNALQGLGEVTVRGSLDRLGIDSSTLKFVEMPFPNMGLALDQKKIDAAWQTEPFLTPALEKGYRMIQPSNTGVEPNLQMAMIFSSKQYVAKNPDVVKRMQRALEKVQQYASDHPDEIRDLAVSEFKLDPAIAKTMRLPVWSPKVNLKSISTIDAMMVKYGMLKEPTNVDDFVANIAK